MAETKLGGIQKSDWKTVIKLEKLSKLAFYIIRVAEVSRNNDADGFGDSSFQSDYFHQEYSQILLVHWCSAMLVFYWCSTAGICMFLKINHDAVSA